MELTSHIRNLVRLMTDTGLKRKPLADEAGLNETAVWAILIDISKNLRVDTIMKLAGALGCKRAELTRYGLEVGGGSMDWVHSIGTVLACRSFAETGAVPASGGCVFCIR